MLLPSRAQVYTCILISLGEPCFFTASDPKAGGVDRERERVLERKRERE